MLYSYGPLSHAGTAKGGKPDGAAVGSVNDRDHGKSRDANSICPASGISASRSLRSTKTFLELGSPNST